MYPDARAAALAVEAVGDLTGLEIPLTELLENARSIEDSVRDIIDNAAQMLPAPDHADVTDIDPSFG
jgi:predicted ATP-grasp superfamily ATP-dependent carboligase